ncbi:MAG TPA: hypothetical protein VFV02_17040 [Acidimicrobiales bacterium]|nr:hypothetical protein [Acidimicrobiales bacterium]
MTPKLLSQWADENGIPRRTAYNWAKSGKLNVPLHRTLTGRLMVLDDEPSEDLDTHPFVAAYAEALGHPVADREGDLDHSPVLEAWGVSLYDAVAEDLRPAVLQLALAAASSRLKDDVPARFSDWIGRVELADWYVATGLPLAAAMVAERGEIADEKSFRDHWPTGAASFEWRMALDDMVRQSLEAVGRGDPSSESTAESYLAENGLIGLDNFAIAGLRENLRNAINALAQKAPEGFPLPEHGELWDLRALYTDPIWSLARPATHHTARVICDLVGWDPEAAAPPPGHTLREVGFQACVHAALEALLPLQHAAHMREIDAFRRIAVGKPFASVTKS